MYVLYRLLQILDHQMTLQKIQLLMQEVMIKLLQEVMIQLLQKVIIQLLQEVLQEVMIKLLQQVVRALKVATRVNAILRAVYLYSLVGHGK